MQKYHRAVPSAAGPECEYFPKLKLPTGQKIVCDESLSARGYVSFIISKINTFFMFCKNTLFMYYYNQHHLERRPVHRNVATW